jgi:hypothetical protein
MRAAGIALCIALAAGALPAATAHAQQARDHGFVERFPRAWCGTFRWDGGAMDQHVTLAFERIELRADGKVEASGPGLVRAGRTVRFTMRAVIEPETRRVEMFESVPPGTVGYVTDGSHVGTLAADLGSVRLVWTTRGTGERGTMELLARPADADIAQPCGPPSS